MAPRQDKKEWTNPILPTSHTPPNCLKEDDLPSPTALEPLPDIPTSVLQELLGSAPSPAALEFPSLLEALERHDRVPSPSSISTSPYQTNSEKSMEDPRDEHSPDEHLPERVTSAPAATLPQKGSPLQAGVGRMFDVPSLTDTEGKYGFTVSIAGKERSTKSRTWLVSTIVNKLYTNINKAVPFEVRMKNPPKSNVKLFIRAVVVFSNPEFLCTNVTRCHNHAAPSEATNHDFPYPNHVVRADHPSALYQMSASGRLSVVVPLDQQQSSSEYAFILLRFMCLGSCVGGISRRPISIVFNLENGQAEVLGCKVIDVRVCGYLTRDIKTDEETVSNKGAKRKGSSVQPQQVIRKKQKTVESRPELGKGSQEVFNIKVLTGRERQMTLTAEI